MATVKGIDTAAHRATLTVHVTFGGVDINPIGGCK